MPANDIFHDIVKKALIKDGWEITHDPFFIRYEKTDFYIDLGAEKIVAAEKEGKKIAVEIKSFLGDSVTYEFHAALGQFINYSYVLEENEPDRILYMAVPVHIYESFFKSRFGQMVIRKSGLRIISYDSEKEEIEEWTD